MVSVLKVIALATTYPFHPFHCSRLGLILYCGIVLSVTAFATIAYLNIKSTINVVGFYVTVSVVG